MRSLGICVFMLGMHASTSFQCMAHSFFVFSLCTGNHVHRSRVIPWAAYMSFVFIIIRIFLFIFVNSIQRFVNFVKVLRNWIEVPMYICSIIFVSVFGTDCYCPHMWQWQVGIAAILLAWIDLINLIRKLQLFDIGMMLYSHYVLRVI